ncbi:MAG: rhamnulokinase, partial [bacterium]|nr:rhamnulokinase [bacterium]
GNVYEYATLVEMAKEANPFFSFIDVNNVEFLYPGNMVEKIKNYCRNTGQKIPESIAQITRVILESLAMEYRFVIE